jgi:hypothetical protein
MGYELILRLVHRTPPDAGCADCTISPWATRVEIELPGSQLGRRYRSSWHPFHDPAGGLPLERAASGGAWQQIRVDELARFGLHLPPIRSNHTDGLPRFGRHLPPTRSDRTTWQRHPRRPSPTLLAIAAGQATHHGWQPPLELSNPMVWQRLSYPEHQAILAAMLEARHARYLAGDVPGEHLPAYLTELPRFTQADFRAAKLAEPTENLFGFFHDRGYRERAVPLALVIDELSGALMRWLAS